MFFIFEKVLKKMKELQFGQIVRIDGPETHLKKQGTPTMGGIAFILIFLEFLLIVVVLLIFLDISVFNFVTLKVFDTDLFKLPIIFIMFGLIGFLDDYLKIIKKNPIGLNGYIKFILQIIFAIIGLYLCKGSFKDSILVTSFLVFIIVGTNNGVNFTDGLDGLCAIVTIIVSILYIIVCIVEKKEELLIVNLVMIVMLMVFLKYNHYPAKLFMGDTGSLFLGAYVAFMAIVLDMQYFLPIFGFIYMMEVVSVILQVSYFKITHGKRLFRMAPIHHHFEKLGMSEVNVVKMFAIVTLIGSIFTYIIKYIIL